MLQTQIVWIRQITSKVDIIIWSLKDLLIDIHPATSKEESLFFSYLIDTRMRDIIKHHQSMYRYISIVAYFSKRQMQDIVIHCGLMNANNFLILLKRQSGSENLASLVPTESTTAIVCSSLFYFLSA